MTTETTFHNRRAVQLENAFVRVTILREGGHIAEIADKATGTNPLWVPPWPSIEPTSYKDEMSEYGRDAESRLLASIMGHNLCLDLFGPPSSEEAAAGLTVHGEVNIVPYKIVAGENDLTASCTVPLSQLAFERHLSLSGRKVLIAETVHNLSALDRPIGWTQHVTFGPPFLKPSSTQFRVPATKSRDFEYPTDFDWPCLPKPDGSRRDMQEFNLPEGSGGYTAHLLNPQDEQAWFFAFSPETRAVIGYVWKREDYPWIGIWEENRGRTHPPWNARAVTRGMEFGVSPFPETRRAMIKRNTLFDTPCYRWLPAKGSLKANYYAAIGTASAIPENLEGFENVIGTSASEKNPY
ncbi:MAG: hypothetical protein JO108_09885 [Acidobacteriaceae bacterium]|nr:hypothetical protein [Acidobacteriaceae bacterium]